MENVNKYFDRILNEIEIYDPIHSKTLVESIEKRKTKSFSHLRDIVCGYFIKQNIPASQVAHDYLHMIRDMRREHYYFDIYNEYSCKSQQEAFDRVYSDVVVMSYYMNALMISQLLWVHHYDMLMFFREILRRYGEGGSNERVLDIGAGHGLFSKMIQEDMPNYQSIDIIDLSNESLGMSKMILGEEKITYYQKNIINFSTFRKYDVIILGEILEHLDMPFEVLRDVVKELLCDAGCIWITVPTNAPAIDHISLFRSKEEVFELVKKAGLEIVTSHITEANSLTHLVGVFCEKKCVQN